MHLSAEVTMDLDGKRRVWATVSGQPDEGEEKGFPSKLAQAAADSAIRAFDHAREQQAAQIVAEARAREEQETFTPRSATKEE